MILCDEMFIGRLNTDQNDLGQKDKKRRGKHVVFAASHRKSLRSRALFKRFDALKMWRDFTEFMTLFFIPDDVVVAF